MFQYEWWKQRYVYERKICSVFFFVYDFYYYIVRIVRNSILCFFFLCHQYCDWIRRANSYIESSTIRQNQEEFVFIIRVDQIDSSNPYLSAIV